MTTTNTVTIDINDARALLAIASGRLSDAKTRTADLEQLLNTITHQLARARDDQERAQNTYDRACAILEK